jgi:uncharacterized protein
MRIGVISDTHGLLRPEAVERLTGVDHIIHAGDIGAADVIAGLEAIAPTTAIKGNVDVGPWARHYPERTTVTFVGRIIHVVHNVKELDVDLGGIDIVISGHSHKPKIERAGGVLYLNPGSAGPRRFSLPIALAILDLTARAIRPRIHELVG